MEQIEKEVQVKVGPRHVVIDTGLHEVRLENFSLSLAPFTKKIREVFASKVEDGFPVEVFENQSFF